MLKRFFVGVLCVCLIAVCGVFGFEKSNPLKDLLSNTKGDGEKIIIIDAGHAELPNTTD